MIDPATLTAKVRERFQKFLRRDERTGCLIFTGCITHGYGEFKVGNRNQRAHRVAFVMAGGAITPERPHVLHTCPGGDNRACCEPAHLRAGTNGENMKDMVKRLGGHKSKRGLPFGVRTQNGRYVAQARIGNTTASFGTYDSWQEASAVAFLHKNLALYPDLSAN